MYAQGNLITPKEHNINSMIMEIASDIAEEKTAKQFNDNHLIENDDCTVLTDEAQDFFNNAYDTEMDRLYTLVNYTIAEHIK
jgi:hypothetical protein